MPAWRDLASGALPAASADDPAAEAGEWRHGWQFYAADARESYAFTALLAALPPTGKALLLNQQGRHAGDYFATFPLEPAMVAPADRFLTECRRRVWLPLGICATRCPGASCNALLDAHGLHLLSCRLAGRLQSRAYPLERAWMQVCREAGGRVSRPQPLVRRLGLTARRCPATDARRLDFAVFGLPIFGGLPLCADATIVSPLSVEGVPHPGCAEDADAVFAAAIREKRNTYSDLVDSNRCAFLVLAAGTGGRWHEDCIHLVTALARYRAASEPAVLRRSMQLAFQRRWWSLLSVALHNSIATALDPTLDIAEGTFPVASAIYVWVRYKNLGTLRSQTFM